jgi:hypothetical protein
MPVVVFQKQSGSCAETSRGRTASSSLPHDNANAYAELFPNSTAGIIVVAARQAESISRKLAATAA